MSGVTNAVGLLSKGPKPCDLKSDAMLDPPGKLTLSQKNISLCASSVFAHGAAFKNTSIVYLLDCARLFTSCNWPINEFRLNCDCSPVAGFSSSLPFPRSNAVFTRFFKLAIIVFVYGVPSSRLSILYLCQLS